MKKILRLSLLLVLPWIHARAQHNHDHGHDHSHEHTGKNVELTGRHLSQGDLNFEFRLLPDNRVAVIPLNDQHKPIAPGGQDLQLTGGDRSAPVRITFNKEEDRWISEETVPEVQNMPVILRVSRAEHTPVFFRFQLNRAICGECSKMEYACSCDHGH